jgi:sugar transferase (PEP-CTERM system associated)
METVPGAFSDGRRNSRRRKLGLLDKADLRTFRLFGHYLPASILAVTVAELLVLILSVLAASYITSVNPKSFSVELPVQSGLILPAIAYGVLMQICLFSMGLYTSDHLQTGFKGTLSRVFSGLILGTILTIVVGYLWPKLAIGRDERLWALALSIAGIMSIRYVYFVRGKTVLRRRVLTYGAGHRASCIQSLSRRPDYVGSRIIGFVQEPGGENRLHTTAVYSGSGELLPLARRLEIDAIVVAPDERRNRLPTDQLMDCRMAGVEVVDLAEFLERESGVIRVDLITPSSLIFSHGFRRNRMLVAFKRFIDVIFASLFVVLLFPVFIFVAIAIKLEEGITAPVIYKQHRVGLDGGVFRIYKFRSMRLDAEEFGVVQWAEEDDPRITRVGRLIRRLRVDEIPQVFNILQGRMSFVGPRPERPEFVCKLSEQIPYYAERHRVRPGITGWAQICYPYGASLKDAMEKLQYDLYYVKNGNPLLDLFILIQTVEVVLFGKGVR